MTYTSRKQTPLLLHRLNTYVILPLLCAVGAVGVGSFAAAVLNGKAVSVSRWAVFFRIAFSIRLDRPGNGLPIVIGVFLLVFFWFAVHLITWIGMMRWKRYGRNLWLILNIMMTALTIASVWLIGSVYVNDAELLMTLMQQTDAGLLKAVKSVRVGLWAAGGLSALWSGWNLWYYFVRRKLFHPFYAEPLEEIPAAEAVYQPQEMPAVPAVPQEERIAKLLYCPECGRRLNEQDVNFCTGCGRKLVNEKKTEEDCGEDAAALRV